MSILLASRRLPVATNYVAKCPVKKRQWCTLEFKVEAACLTESGFPSRAAKEPRNSNPGLRLRCEQALCSSQQRTLVIGRTWHVSARSKNLSAAALEHALQASGRVIEFHLLFVKSFRIKSSP